MQQFIESGWAAPFTGTGGASLRFSAAHPNLRSASTTAALVMSEYVTSFPLFHLALIT